jgi:hypothetical protein
MPTLFQRSATWLGTRLQNAAGRTATYTRYSGTTVALTAVPSVHAYEVVDEGIHTLVTSWDFVIPRDDLGFDPAQGDQITETLNSVATVYEVQPIGSLPCFEWLDSSGLLLKVHTKKVDED